MSFFTNRPTSGSFRKLPGVVTIATFNYPVEVFSEWLGKPFYICAEYRARSRCPEDDFFVRSARMTLRDSAVWTWRFVIPGAGLPCTAD